jgi:uncharacterized membrane protein
VFVRYYVTIDRPIEQCRRVLLESPDEWMPHLVQSSEGPAHQLLARMGFSVLAVDVRKKAVVQLGRPLELRDWLHIPISWEAQPVSDLFPRFEGELQLVPIGPDQTKLALAGTYDPPLGDVGRAVDNLLMHTAAEATVKDFVEGLGRRLEKELQQGGHATGDDHHSQSIGA